MFYKFLLKIRIVDKVFVGEIHISGIFYLFKWFLPQLPVVPLMLMMSERQKSSFIF